MWHARVCLEHSRSIAQHRAATSQLPSPRLFTLRTITTSAPYASKQSLPTQNKINTHQTPLPHSLPPSSVLRTTRRTHEPRPSPQTTSWPWHLPLQEQNTPTPGISNQPLPPQVRDQTHPAAHIPDRRERQRVREVARLARGWRRELDAVDAGVSIVEAEVAGARVVASAVDVEGCFDGVGVACRGIENLRVDQEVEGPFFVGGCADEGVHAEAECAVAAPVSALWRMGSVKSVFAAMKEGLWIAVTARTADRLTRYGSNSGQASVRRRWPSKRSRWRGCSSVIWREMDEWIVRIQVSRTVIVLDGVGWEDILSRRRDVAEMFPAAWRSQLEDGRIF